MKKLTTLLTMLFVINAVALAQDRMTPELLWKLGRLGTTILVPGDQEAIYGVKNYDLAEDSGKTTYYRIPLNGGEPTLLFSNEEKVGDVQVQVMGGALKVFCTSKRDGDEATQAWCYTPDGNVWTRLTNIPDGIGNLKVAPGGKSLAFTRDVKLDQTVHDLYADLPKADARIIDDLLYRHWDSWHDHSYSHLFVAPLIEDQVCTEAIDLFEGMRADCPVPPFGGSEQFNFSDDGAYLAFTRKGMDDFEISTNTDVFEVSIHDALKGQKAEVCVSAGMPGYDMEPSYSPNGRYLAFHSMLRPGFESDRNRIMIRDRQTGAIWDLTEGLDQTAHGITWHPNSGSVYFRSEREGTDQLFEILVEDRSMRQISSGQFNWALAGINADGSRLLLKRQDMSRPWEAFVSSSTGTGDARVLTHINDAIYGNLSPITVKPRWVDATDGKKIHSWIIYPPGFDANKKYPMLIYFQGGPQGQIGQWFSYRWNFHLMAAQGYVVTAINRRGLPGFGREWNDQISKDWGGQCMKDILSVTDVMLAEPYVDTARVGGIGASFGGYTAYWMMGNSGDRFSSMIAHAGVFNLESMYGGTEELFFVNWDLGGPYWKSEQVQADYNQFSPHRFIGNWKTPLLVIHGEKDFRVPIGQGMEAFTAAQVQGVPSRFLYFPNEGHWVLKPQNGVLWHRVFFEWLDRTLK